MSTKKTDHHDITDRHDITEILLKVTLNTITIHLHMQSVPIVAKYIMCVQQK
jgi:hypothetical protein